MRPEESIFCWPNDWMTYSNFDFNNQIARDVQRTQIDFDFHENHHFIYKLKSIKKQQLDVVNKWLFYYTNLNWLAAQKVYIWNFSKTIHIVGIFPIVEIEIWVMFRSPIESQNVREMLWLLIAENVTRKCFSYSANWSGHWTIIFVILKLSDRKTVHELNFQLWPAIYFGHATSSIC